MEPGVWAAATLNARPTRCASCHDGRSAPPSLAKSCTRHMDQALGCQRIQKDQEIRGNLPWIAPILLCHPLTKVFDLTRRLDQIPDAPADFIQTDIVIARGIHDDNFAIDWGAHQPRGPDHDGVEIKRHIPAPFLSQTSPVTISYRIRSRTVLP